MSPWQGTAPDQTFIRTDGTRSGITVWQDAEAAGVDIVADDHDTHDQDIASALNDLLRRDGGNKASGTIRMAGQGIGLNSANDVVLKAFGEDRVSLGFGSASAELFRFIATARSAQVNGIDFVAAGSGAEPFIQAHNHGGGDTVLDFPIRPLGSGAAGLQGETGNWILRGVDPGTSQGANYIQITTGSAGTGARIAAAGSDASIDLVLNPKGAGDIVIDGLRWPTADGGAGQSIKTDGAGKLSFAAVEGMTLIGGVTLDSGTIVDFTGLTSAYDEYEISILNWAASNSGQSIDTWLRFSTDGGATFLAGASDYQGLTIELASGSGRNELAALTAQIHLNATNIQRQDTNQGLFGRLRISRPNEMIDTLVTFVGGSHGGAPRTVHAIARVASQVAVNAVRLTTNTTNAIGKFKLYGIKKS